MHERTNRPTAAWDGTPTTVWLDHALFLYQVTCLQFPSHIINSNVPWKWSGFSLPRLAEIGSVETWSFASKYIVIDYLGNWTRKSMTILMSKKTAIAAFSLFFKIFFRYLHIILWLLRCPKKETFLYLMFYFILVNLINILLLLFLLISTCLSLSSARRGRGKKASSWSQSGKPEKNNITTSESREAKRKLKKLIQTMLFFLLLRTGLMVSSTLCYSFMGIVTYLLSVFPLFQIVTFPVRCDFDEA